MKPTILVVVLLILAGCGEGPLCESPSRESQFMSGCTASGGSTASVCRCGWDYLADRHTCSDFEAGNITFSEINDAAESCAFSKTSGAADAKAGAQACGVVPQ